MNEPTLDTKEMKALYKAILQLDSPAECKKFLRDICTLSELNAMAERWQVAQMVDQATPYREISKQTGVSTATITRVAHWIHHGMGGYRLMLDRLKR